MAITFLLTLIPTDFCASLFDVSLVFHSLSDNYNVDDINNGYKSYRIYFVLYTWHILSYLIFTVILWMCFIHFIK